MLHSLGCFFFQAEDGIRDWSVTGVQTCALPISQAARAATGRQTATSPSPCAKLPAALDDSALAMNCKKTKPALSTSDARRTSLRQPQIGRASCRERGETAGGARA